MSLSTHGLLSAVLLFIVLALLACESAPVQELTKARQAISAAKAAVSKESIPTLDKAEKLIFQAETAMYGGDYRQARESAEAAIKQAILAQELIASH